MKKVLETLDQLALALTNHNHTWTIEERQNYEQSIKTVKGLVDAQVKPQGELLLCERNKTIEECAKTLEEEAKRIFELKERESSVLSEITQNYFDMEGEIRKNCAIGLRQLALPTEQERRAEEEAAWQN